MKPQELRIGNIVKTMGNDYDIVVDLLCDSLNTLYSTRGSWMYDDILPVKLTLAILDKNGFIFNPEETYEYEANRFINMPVSLRSQYKEDIKNIELTLCMNQDYMWMVYFDSQLVAVLQYVHELQNLYFLTYRRRIKNRTMTQQQLKEKYYPLYIGAKAITYAALHKYYDVLNLINILEFIDKDESKLILKPLSDITDEDAIEVVKVLLHNPDSFENSDLLVMAKHILFDSSFIEYSYVKIINAINLLRSRHYDIDNLIDQRIAIDENSLNQ